MTQPQPDGDRYRFRRPDPERARAAWRAGRADGNGGKPLNRDAYRDRALQAMFLHGYTTGRQESLQVRYGDPPTG